MDFIHLWVVAVDLGFTTLLTSQVISVAFYSEREKSDKFCSEALISAWGTFTCRKYTTRDPRLYFLSEGNHTQNFYSVKKIHRPRSGLNPRTSDLVTSMITTGLPGSTYTPSKLFSGLNQRNAVPTGVPNLVRVLVSRGGQLCWAMSEFLGLSWNSLVSPNPCNKHSPHFSFYPPPISYHFIFSIHSFHVYA